MTIQPLMELKRVPIAYLEQYPTEVLFAAGVVSPYGPTLTLAAKQRAGVGRLPSLVCARLNPIASRAVVAGRYERGASDIALAEQVNALISRATPFDHGVPTLFPRCEGEDAGLRRAVAARLLRAQTGLPLVLERLRQHRGDPWNRMMSQVSDSMHNAMQLLDGELSEERTGEPPAAHCVEAFLDLVLDGEHRDLEVKAFVTAWETAIRFHRPDGGANQVRKPMGIDRLRRLLETLGIAI